MARPYTTKEAAALINDHKKAISDLIAGQNLTERLKRDVEDAAKKMASKEVLKALKDIPVEELNRDKSGIRVKTLRDYGYESIADLTSASEYSLASINGITAEKAQAIRRKVDSLVYITQQSVKIRLSVDDKSQEASDLVQRVYQYKKGKVISATCNK